MIDPTQMGLSWNAGDTAMTIANPFYGLYRLFTRGEEEGAPTGRIQDIKKTAAYKALLAQEQQADRRTASAEKLRQEALQALAAVRAAPSQSAAPIELSVPSFSLGRRMW